MNILNKDQYEEIKDGPLYNYYNNPSKFKEDLPKLLISSYKLNTKCQEQFLSMCRILEEVYPGKWDFSIDGAEIFGFIIHFDKVHITNKHGLEHDIEDLFVEISFINRLREDKLVIQLNGAKTTFTDLEQSAVYTHSHLSGSAILESLNFCTGSGEINNTIAYLYEDGFTEDNFEVLLIQIMRLVSWESIDGTPYRYIKNIPSSLSTDSIGDRSSTTNLLYEIRSIMSDMYDYDSTEMEVEENLFKFSLDTTEGVSIVNKEEVEVELLKCLKSTLQSDDIIIGAFNEEWEDYVNFIHNTLVKNINGSLHHLSGDEIDLFYSNSESHITYVGSTSYDNGIIFRGKFFPYTIKNTSDILSSKALEIGLVLHPDALANTYSSIEKRINEYIIIKHA